MSALPNNFKIFLYNQGVLIGEVLEVAEFSFGEKENDFVDSELSLICNKANQDILENFVCDCEIRILMKIDDNFRLVWAGRAMTRPQSGVDAQGIFTKKTTFWHIGKIYTNLVSISKNYNVPTDEALIAGDIIDYSQTPSMHSTIYSLTLQNYQVDYGINNNILQMTGKSRVIDFTKDVTVADALKQLTEAENPTTSKKTWQISPTILDNSLGNFNFYYNKKVNATDNFGNPVIFVGILSNNSDVSNAYQDIVSIGISSEIPYTGIIASGDNDLKVALVTSDLESLNTLKFRPKYVAYKNVKDLITLTDLANKDLKKLQNPIDVVDFEISFNNPFVGYFGVGDWIKIDFENRLDKSSSVKGDFRVYEFKIIFDAQGITKCQLKVAKEDFPETLSGGFEALVAQSNRNNKLLKIITQN